MSRTFLRACFLTATLVLALVLWVLKVEVTYERNVRHIPTGFETRPHPALQMWKA